MDPNHVLLELPKVALMGKLFGGPENRLQVDAQHLWRVDCKWINAKICGEEKNYLEGEMFWEPKVDFRWDYPTFISEDNDIILGARDCGVP